MDVGGVKRRIPPPARPERTEGAFRRPGRPARRGRHAARHLAGRFGTTALERLRHEHVSEALGGRTLPSGDGSDAAGMRSRRPVNRVR